MAVMSLPEPFSRTAQGSQDIDLHYAPLRSAIRYSALKDPHVGAQLVEKLPSATKQLHDIINDKSALHIPLQSAPTPTASAQQSLLAASATPASVDRLNTSLKTVSGRFSMVYAVSQGLLNQSFQNLFVVNETLQRINYDGDIFGSIDSELIAPQISLSVVGSDAPLWYMNFGTGGTCKLYDRKVKKLVPYPTDNWVLVFGVNLGSIPVPSGTDDHTAIINAIGTNSPGDYSITRLIMDFSTAQVDNLRWDLCNFPGVTMTPDIKAGISNLLSYWIQDAIDSNAGTLGYTWTTPNPQNAYSNAPSFPPTDKIYQTYPYLATPTSPLVQGLGVGDDNMLLYLEMTQHLPFPKERALTYTANWTTPTIPATMCIGSTVFFDSYLMRSMSGNNGDGLLGQLNAATWMDALSCTASYGLTSKFSWNWGWASHDPTFFDWKPNGLGYTWHQTSSKSARDNSSPGCYAESSITTDTYNNIVVAQGGNSITLSGVATVTLTTNIVVLGVPQSSSSTVKNTWSIKMTADSILAGGLQLNMNLPANDSDLFKITTSNSTSWNQPKSTVNQLCADLASKGQINRIRSTATTLQNALNGTGKFFFPGGGTLLYRKALFNNENDLLVEASYDGAADALGRKAVGRFAKK